MDCRSLPGSQAWRSDGLSGFQVIRSSARVSRGPSWALRSCLPQQQCCRRRTAARCGDRKRRLRCPRRGRPRQPVAGALPAGPTPLGPENGPRRARQHRAGPTPQPGAPTRGARGGGPGAAGPAAILTTAFPWPSHGGNAAAGVSGRSAGHVLCPRGEGGSAASNLPHSADSDCERAQRRPFCVARVDPQVTCCTRKPEGARAGVGAAPAPRRRVPPRRHGCRASAARERPASATRKLDASHWYRDVYSLSEPQCVSPTRTAPPPKELPRSLHSIRAACDSI